MTESQMATQDDLGEGTVLRIYEVGYLVLPTVGEAEIETTVNEIRSVIEKARGTFIAEGAPVSIKLAYPMFVHTGGKRTPYDRASFGWIKFETDGATANELRAMLLGHPSILRSLIFKTVREDTRASARRAVLREVRRTDTITSTPKKGADESAGVVSEEALDKSIEQLIAD